MITNIAFRLPCVFDSALLKQDIETATQHSWKAHHNAADYAGSWQSLALRSISGTEDDARAQAGAPYHNTPLLEKLPYLRQVMTQFHCPLEAVRLLRLAAGSEIKEHRDPFGGYADGCLRIHVPVETNPDVVFLVGGERWAMQEGECWYADFSLPHRVTNYGKTDRIHLVIDGIRNAWTDELFRSAGYDFAAEAASRRPDKQVVLRTIAELQQQDSEHARRLAEKLAQELHT